MPAVLVDAGPLIALIERTDRHHERCVATLQTLTDPLVTVWPAFTEAMYLLRDDERSQEALWGMVESGGLEYAELTADDASRTRSLMYPSAQKTRAGGPGRHNDRDQPMDLVHAALVRVAERDGLRKIFTLDRRHFEVYRINKRARFIILP